MNKLIQKFIFYFIISSFVYYLFLIIEKISLYFNEYGFDLMNGITASFIHIAAVINFGIFIAFIIITKNLLKEKVPIPKIFKFGLFIFITFGGLIFLLSNNVVPEFRMKSLLNRYEYTIKEVFNSQERADKARGFKKKNADMMNIESINKYSDSLENVIISQKKTIAKSFQKIPDSIIESDFSTDKLAEYNISKNKLTTKFRHRDLYKLKSEISKNDYLAKQLKKMNWEKNERYIDSLLPLFLISFGILVGANFRNQLIFSLVCIGIVFYILTFSLLITMSDYFIDGENLIGLIFKVMIILIVFFYLVYRIQTNKNIGANSAK